jgi:hypothetical protein
MKLTTLFLAVAFSFVLGAWLFHTPQVKANPQAGSAHVFIAPIEMFDLKSSTSKSVPGVRIAGISCVAKPKANLPDAAICYVATSLE